jgi:hypothetical protein
MRSDDLRGLISRSRVRTVELPRTWGVEGALDVVDG